MRRLLPVLALAGLAAVLIRPRRPADPYEPGMLDWFADALERADVFLTGTRGQR